MRASSSRLSLEASPLAHAIFVALILLLAIPTWPFALMLESPAWVVAQAVVVAILVVYVVMSRPYFAALADYSSRLAGEDKAARRKTTRLLWGAPWSIGWRAVGFTFVLGVLILAWPIGFLLDAWRLLDVARLLAAQVPEVYLLPESAAAPQSLYANAALEAGLALAVLGLWGFALLRVPRKAPVVRLLRRAARDEAQRAELVEAAIAKSVQLGMVKLPPGV